MTAAGVERSAELRRRLFADVSDGLLVFDARTYRILDANPAAAALWGWSREEFLRLSVPQLGTEPSLVRRDMAVMRRRGSGTFLGRPAVRKDQTVFTIDIRFDRFRWRGKALWIAMIRDHSRRRRADDYQALKLRTEIVRASLMALSHELRTPIAAIKAFAEALIDGRTGAAQRRHFLGGIARQADRLAALVDHSMALTQRQAMRLERAERSTDLGDGVREAVSGLRALADRRRIRVSARTGTGPRVALDSFELSRVLLNLLGNAIKHNRPGGRVRVWVERRVAEAALCVSDDGPGISSEDLPRIFERFYRGREARRRGVPGVGLGLALSREIVEGNGGRLWVESAEGRGARFWAALPLASRAATTRSRNAPTP